MDLLDYIKLHHGGNQSDFAKLAKLDKGTVSRLCKKETYPSQHTSNMVFKATAGQVGFTDLYDQKAGAVALNTKQDKKLKVKYD